MKKQNGFTLIELMATTVIMVLLVSVAVPSFKSMFEQKNTPKIAKSFERSIKYARTEAINRNALVQVRSTSGTKDWSQGWYIELTNGDLIRRFNAIPGNPTFTSKTFDDTNKLQIMANGQAISWGEFDLYYSDNCQAGSFSFELLTSGLLKKKENACP